MRKIPLLMLASFMTVSGALAGCSQGPAPSAADSKSQQPAAAAPPSTAAKKNEPVTLRMTYWAGSQLTVDKNNAVIELFQKANPNIKIEAEYYAGDAYNDKINVQAASNSLPDIVRVDYSQIQNYVNKGILRPLDDFIANKTIDMTGVAEVNMKGGIINGKNYGINIGNNALVMFYDPEKLEKAGIKAPGPDYTWDQYEKDLQTAKDKLNIYGDTHLMQSHFEVWLRQHGKSLYNQAQDAIGYDDDKLFTDFMNMQLKWQKAGTISPMGVELEVRGLEDGPFPKGQAAFGGFGYWSNHADIMETQLKKPMGMAMYPGSGDGKGMYMKPSFFHSIAASSKHPEEAAKFIEFFTNNLDAAKSLNAYFGMPYHPKLIAGMQSTFSDTQKRVSQYLQIVEKHSSTIDPPAPVAGAEVSKIFTNIRAEVFYEKITPDKAAEKFRKEANAALAKKK
ncbi:ABC transporter substrate-binding protein [Paenibacillus thalictri]|uniref:Extracellular solute-binding protein n=1 Tax=Paenibacillus thalictri TaxID=2527873 RepID=A0A4Q9DW76_9BACL|nr:extracellular solute-binding protein [Paenibacillus thalictri]TBL80646.1 extracellular solute-binding protein [Paenibacillus thalictri]